jgi:hypothetical protein
MHAQHESSNSFPVSMSVDVRLCGSIPRQDMKSFNSSASCSLQACVAPRVQFNLDSIKDAAVGNSSAQKTLICPQLPGLMEQVIRVPMGPIVEPPSWAVPAKGETRLEVRMRFSSSCIFTIAFFTHMLPFCSLSVKQQDDTVQLT